jgi:hypothetical protein
MRHAFPRVLKILHLKLAQFLAPQRVEQQRGQDGAVAPALDGLCLRRIQQLARLMIADRRRLAFAAFRLRPFDAFDRVMGDGIFLAEIYEQRGKRREAMPDRAAAKVAPHEIIAPCYTVCPRHGAKFLRPLDRDSPAFLDADRALEELSKNVLASMPVKRKSFTAFS